MPTSAREIASRIALHRRLRVAAARIAARPRPAPPPTINISVGSLTIRADSVTLAADTFAPNVTVEARVRSRPVVVNLPEQPAATVTVNVPTQQPAAVTVHVPQQPAPHVTVQQGEVRAVVQLPERRPAPTRTVTVEGPDGEEWTGTIGEGG